MNQIKELFFGKLAIQALERALSEFRTLYVMKKGRRFNVDNITYEIGEPKVTDGFLEYEISSKLPEAELGEKFTIEEYFSKVREVFIGREGEPAEIGMDEIVRKGSENEIKTRDYVRIKFRCNFASLYDDKELVNRYEKIKRGESNEKISPIAGVNTDIGCMALKMVEENIYSLCKKNIEALKYANDEIRKKLGIKTGNGIS